MRVLAVAPTPFFGDYGCHVRIVEEVAALAAHDVITTIVTYPFGRDLPGMDIQRASRSRRHRAIAPGSSSQKFTLDIALLARALAAARETRPDLIHGHLHEGALIGWLVSRLRRVPLVFDFQGSLTAEMVDHGFLAPRGPAYTGFRLLERWIVQRADAIVTSTAQGAQLLVDEFGCAASRVSPVPDGVNVERFAPIGGDAIRRERVAELRVSLGIPAGRPVVVYLGLLAEYQGITHLLQAAKALVDEGVHAHFLVMGHPGEERYRILAARLKLADYVTFTGAIPYERAPDYLALGDVAVSPKLSLTEGNGKLLNYIAMGLPTVTYDNRVSRDILGDLGIYAPAGDWSALAIELKGALQDPKAAHSRGKALRRKAMADHQWAKSIQPLLGVYTQLLEMRRAQQSQASS
jgi:glycosyltransferase involved in cell wall biosynthesis